MHLKFCMDIYMHQIKHGRYFIHEHPAFATSWDEPCVKQVLRQDGVDRIVCDQCQHGAQDESGNPIRKPTAFMSNAEEKHKHEMPS